MEPRHRVSAILTYQDWHIVFSKPLIHVLFELVLNKL